MRFLIFILLVNIAFAKVTILQTLDLDNTKFKEAPFHEISGATFDKENNTLYLISDKGILYLLNASFDNKVHLKPISAFYLRKKNGKRLKHSKRDSEDIVLDNNNNLFISLEGKPKIYKISKSGIKLKKIKLPKKLKNAKLRSQNKSLESLAFNKEYGLLTALELPPRGTKKSNQTIYSLNGKKWHYKTANVKNSAITAIESIDNNNILVLERAYSGIFSRHAITLQELNLNTDKQKLIWQFDGSSDYIENYEALAKVGKNRYIIISDDNNNFFQKTKLIYFEIQ